MALLELSELEAFSPFFRGKRGNARARWLLRKFRMDEVERSYAAVENLKGPESAAVWLEKQDVHYSVSGFEKLLRLGDGPFITISNHTIGSVDGIIMIALMGRLRPDYKMMVNNFLSRLKVLEDNFIQVTPTGDKRTAPTSVSLSGIRAAMQHLEEGHPLGFFPAGAVSDLKPGCRPRITMPDGSTYKEPRIRDREWQLSVVKLIKRAGVPVVPIRFFDGNSMFFYSLGLIDWRVRLLRQPAEVVNKNGKTIRLGVGDIITPEMQAACGTPEELRTLLRGAVYSQKI